MMVVSMNEMCWWLSICSKIHFMKVHLLVYCIIVVEALLQFISVISLPSSGSREDICQC